MNVSPIYTADDPLDDNGINYCELENGIDEVIIQNPNATFIGLATGNSMQGVGIFDGDLLVVDRSAEAKHGDVIVAQYNNLFTCKILDLNKRQLISANKEYQSANIGSLDQFVLEGVVVSSIRLHRKINRYLNY